MKLETIIRFNWLQLKWGIKEVFTFLWILHLPTQGVRQRHLKSSKADPKPVSFRKAPEGLSVITRRIFVYRYFRNSARTEVNEKSIYDHCLKNCSAGSHLIRSKKRSSIDTLTRSRTGKNNSLYLSSSRNQDQVVHHNDWFLHSTPLFSPHCFPSFGSTFFSTGQWQWAPDVRAFRALFYYIEWRMIQMRSGSRWGWNSL